VNLAEAVDLFRLYAQGTEQAFPRRTVEHMDTLRVKPHIPGGTGGNGAGRGGNVEPTQFLYGLSVNDKGETRR
jgi:hypothetical protein